MKSSTFLSGLFAGLMLTFLAGATAQNLNDSDALLLKFGNVNVTENVNDYVLNFELSEQEIIDGKYFKIIQFYSIPDEDQITAMENSGLEFLEYIPRRAYLVAIPENFPLGDLQYFNARNITDIIPEFKQDMYLLDQNFPSWALRDNNQIDLLVTYYRNLAFDNTTMELSPLVNQVIQDDPLSHSQILRVDISRISEIVALPQVYFVEPVYPEGEPENYTAKTLHRSNVLDSQYETGRHYDGTGVKVMLQDDGIIGPHIDYEGRIGAQNLTYNYGDHGDHCAGTIFGSGNLDPTTSGMAPGAELHTWGAAPSYPGFNSMETAYSQTGIRISSTSYSNGCNAGYTSLARTMDLQVHTYGSLMHVFSAGNAGNQNCGYGAGSGWGNVTGGHKIGKNVIATANLNSTGGLSNSSSRGPAHDGRIKPDISAKGSSVYSTIDPHDYGTKSGTSMACPGIAGSLAQLFQAYQELNAGTEPPGGLLKALILNTADDLGNTGPDFKHGWGQINNLKAVKTLENENYVIESITQGESKSHTINVPDGVKEMKVMVYWTDKEASVNASVALVNNLDITVSDPSSDVHYPWLLNHYPHPDSLNKPAVKGIDMLNNVEQVQINDPAEGSYTLSVEGTEVPFGPQEYYVLYHYTFDDLSLTYPIGGESFNLNESVMVRWDAHGNQDPFTLEYTLDNGSNWTTISSSISGSQRHFYWSAPNEMTGNAKIRISRNDLTSESEDVFSVMSIPNNIYVARACEESVLLRWNHVDGADSYDVFILGEKYMEVVGSTSADSLFINDVSSEVEQWFSVRAVGPDNAIGRRAIAIMKDPGTWDCLVTKDISLNDILSPPLGVLFNCQDLNEINIQVELENTAIIDVSDITLYYEFNGEPVVSEVYPGTIAAGETVFFEFSSAISLPEAGDYDLEVWFESAGDQFEDNNMISGSNNVKSVEYLENNLLITFDEYTDCSSDPDCEAISCYLDEKYVNHQNMINDDIDWRVFTGITPTPYTGPLGDHTTSTGKYLYLEASGNCENKKAVLTTPCVDLSGSSSPALTFWYSMNGADMGSLHIDAVSDGILYRDIMDPISGDMGYDWFQGQADLSQFNGNIINLRFRGYTGNGELSDLAIDDIMITEMTNIEESYLPEAINIFPNPSEGQFNLTIENEILTSVEISVVDITGRTLLEQQFDEIKSNSPVVLDISAFENGIYFLVIKADKQQLKKRLLKY